MYDHFVNGTRASRAAPIVALWYPPLAQMIRKKAGRQRAFLRPVTVWLLELGVRWLWREMHRLLRDWRAWAYHVATPVHCPRGWLPVTEAPGVPWQVMMSSRAGIRKAILEMGPPCLEVMSLPGGG